ncbi:methylenetetrahydrofolate reductase [Propionibacteriaceae bacterium Y1923]|uniref:methylenetetrahydrofolate reductase n=1 Tax=Aestuariimicrobium sp. Y1814 TaxID=3418742 RepID=UPI003C24093D
MPPAENQPTDRPTIAQLLREADRPLFSFEFMPPRSEDEVDLLWRAIEKLEPLDPDFVSVTYGANGSNRERTIRTTKQIIERTALQTIAHLTVVEQPAAQLRQVLDDYSAAGVNHVLALRGDPPGGAMEDFVAHPEGLNNATDLVRLVKECGDFCVGVAAYTAPRESGGLAQEARVLAAKAEAGAEYAITQLFYEPDDYFDLVDAVRAEGCELPIIPGIMPVSTIGQLDRFRMLGGTDLPQTMVDRLMAVADDPEEVRKVGARICTELAVTLLRGGAPGLHFFTLNRSKATTRIFEMLSGRRW